MTIALTDEEKDKRKEAKYRKKRSVRLTEAATATRSEMYYLIAEHHSQYSVDDRIKAIMPFASDYDDPTDPGVPALFLAGTRDIDAPPSMSRLMFDATETMPRYLGVIEDAGHWSFFDTCSGLDPDHEVCSPPFLPNEEVLDILNLYATAFFQTELNDRDEYAFFLTPGFAASLPVELSAVVPEPTCGWHLLFVLLWLSRLRKK